MEQPNSITGWTKEELFRDTPAPSWLAEAEARYGPMRKTCAMQLPGERTTHLTAFERGWRLTLRNPANPPDLHETDIWLSPESMESILLLEAILRAEPLDQEHPFPALETLMASLQLHAKRDIDPLEGD
jgi:hypothetical protein